MKLELEFGYALCYLPTFIINGVDAEDTDFGEKYDRSPDTAEDYACGDMQFTSIPSTQEVLDKYSIAQNEYDEVCTKLEGGLSFGSCGWCV